MAHPNWKPKLETVLKHETIEVERYSEKTGNNYKTDVIQQLRVFSVGSVEKLDNDNYRYAIADSSTGLEYEIKVPKKIEVRFGMTLEFTNVCGGEMNNVGWYKADDVKVVQRKQNA